jgi:hypothetical protein
MKKMNWGIVFLLVATGGASVSGADRAWASAAIGSCPKECESSCSSRKPDGGSGGLPGGLALNTFVEMADGERYQLIGEVLIIRGEAFFHVDLDEHPWLGTSSRKAVPFYPLEGSTSMWKKYANKRVQVIVMATGRIGEQKGEHVYQIFLSPIKDPVIKHRR